MQNYIKGSLHMLPEDMAEKLIHLPLNKRLDYFEEIQELFSDDLYWTVLRTMWIDDGICSEKWSRWMFAPRKRHHKIMKSSDRQTLKKLPKTVKIYRACDSPEVKLNEAFNWTLSEDIAKRFHKAFIFTKIIDKKEIYAYFNSRKEQEVIIDIRRIGKCG